MITKDEIESTYDRDYFSDDSFCFVDIYSKQLKNNKMHKLEIRYKYKVGQVVFFMYKNEIRKGIITNIDIDIKSKMLATYLTKKIIDKAISIFDKDYPFEKRIRYSLDLVSKSGDFESAPHLLFEYDVYENKNELVEALSSSNVTF